MSMSAAGIIAAGDGSRLAGIQGEQTKSLLLTAGRPLAHWVVDGLRAAQARRITVLTNSRGGAVSASLRTGFPDTDFDFLTADTASSFESFRLVSLRLADGCKDFLISTVDALVPPTEVARFLAACRRSGAEAGLALTRFIDDEKPLWADLDADGRVSALGEAAAKRDAVTCGLYYMTQTAAARLPAADAHGRLRDFWAGLAREGARISGVVLAKTLDVDRPEDLAAADAFLRGA